MLTEFKKEIDKGLSEICNRIGFKKKGYYFAQQATPNVSATLFFGSATHRAKGHIFINVSVGVAYTDVNQLYFRLTDDNNPVFGHTIREHIGYLMPVKTYKEWDFVEGNNISDTFEEILSSIQSYGFQYFEKMKDFNNLFKAFETRAPGTLHEARDRYLPILYYMRGEKQKGLEFIEEAIEREQKPPDQKELDMMKIGRPGSQFSIGSGVGKVSPEYLKFVENYKSL